MTSDILCLATVDSGVRQVSIRHDETDVTRTISFATIIPRDEMARGYLGLLRMNRTATVVRTALTYLVEMVDLQTMSCRGNHLWERRCRAWTSLFYSQWSSFVRASTRLPITFTSAPWTQPILSELEPSKDEHSEQELAQNRRYDDGCLDGARETAVAWYRLVDVGRSGNRKRLDDPCYENQCSSSNGCQWNQGYQ